MHLGLVLLLILSVYVLSSVALVNAQLVESNLKDTTGIINWLQEPNPSNEIGLIQVIDKDVIINPNLVEQVKVTVWSYSDPVPKVISLDETKPGSGIFQGKVFFTNLSYGSNTNTVFVKNSDKVTAQYLDQYTQIGKPVPLDATFFVTGSSPPPTCIAPQVLDPKTGTCVTPLPICTTPQVLDPTTDTCVTPPPTCVAPQILDPKTNTCVTPPPTCVAPQILDPTTNTCVTSTPVCTSSQVLDPKTNTCVTPIPDWTLPVAIATVTGGGVIGLSVTKGWIKLHPSKPPPVDSPKESPRKSSPPNVPSTFQIEIKAGMKK